MIREWLAKNQIFVFFLLLFATTIFVEDFVIDSVLMTLSSAFALSFLVYKLIETVFLILRKERHKIFDFNFLASLAIAIIIFTLTLSSQNIIKKNEDALAESIGFCVLDEECKAVVNGVKVARTSDKNFSVTSGVVTLVLRVDKEDNGCLRVYSLYLKLINARRC